MNVMLSRSSLLDRPGDMITIRSDALNIGNSRKMHGKPHKVDCGVYRTQAMAWHFLVEKASLNFQDPMPGETQ